MRERKKKKMMEVNEQNSGGSFLEIPFSFGRRSAVRVKRRGEGGGD